MDARKRRILKAIVENYISGAEPVGSKTLAGQPGLDVSPATLRNEMAALEAMGFLEHPHTSAGRVPTPMGYRMYVDELMQAHRLSRVDQEAIGRIMRIRISELDRMILQAGKILADITHYAAVAATQRERSVEITRLELFLADSHTLVMVAVLEGGFVSNKLARLPFAAQEENIRKLGVILSRNKEPLKTPETELREAGEGYAVWPYVKEFLSDLAHSGDEVFISGETHLLAHPEFHDVLRAKRTLEYITGQREMLVRRAPGIDGVRITIGPENAAEELADTSVVMASYQLGDGLRGMIGIVGPTRMDYSKLVSRLEFFVSRLEKLTRDEDG